MSLYAERNFLHNIMNRIQSLCSRAQKTKWATCWAASVQGPYPFGYPSAQPDLSFAFPFPQRGANNQSFRMILMPDIWGKQTRIRLSNVFGTKPVTFDGVFIALQHSSSEIIKGTNHQIKFNKKESVTIKPGDSVWSDPVTLSFTDDPDFHFLAGRNLAISFHITGESGPMTWHAKGLTTSYITLPDAGSKGDDESEVAFPFATASWFFVDAVDMLVSANTRVIAAFGDSISDGTASTMNGNDRWPNVLSRRIHSTYGNKAAVINAGIGGNRIASPDDYSAENPCHGGPSAKARIERDVLSLSGISSIIWLEGTNDFSKIGNSEVAAAIATMTEVVNMIRSRKPEIKIFGATVLPVVGSTLENHGSAEQEANRISLNNFIINSGLFDGVIDFRKIMTDEKTGELRPEFVPDNTTGSAGDKLHPNRFGYITMGSFIDIDMLMK